MKTVGIICECNPFHAGHGYLIEQAKRAGADAVIALMSGCFVQRGEPAIIEPSARARLMLLGGADAVLELPFPYSAAGAEFFGAAGVEILDRLGVDELWFGSECGDLNRLQRLARALDDPAFERLYAEKSSQSMGTAEAFLDCLKSFCGDENPCLSNDILAISYLRALNRLSSGMKPITVQRIGSAYRAEKIGDLSEYPSATALRRLWEKEGLDAILPFLPTGAKEILEPCVDAGKAPASFANAERLILGHFRMEDPAHIEQIAELSGGLGSRMMHAAQSANSYESFLALSETKKYPRARLRRGILFALTDLSRQSLKSSPAYVRLLAANAKGREFLSLARKGARIAVLTKRADLPEAPEAQLQAEWERRAWALYTLCMPKPHPADIFWKQAPFIE